MDSSGLFFFPDFFNLVFLWAHWFYLVKCLDGSFDIDIIGVALMFLQSCPSDPYFRLDELGGFVALWRGHCPFSQGSRYDVANEGVNL